jgi:uncharacterized repeat protein (TIGR04138 family)
VQCTTDFGHIVFNLVEANLMRRSDSDRIEDFRDVFDFRQVFRIDVPPRAGGGGGSRPEIGSA